MIYFEAQKKQLDWSCASDVRTIDRLRHYKAPRRGFVHALLSNITLINAIGSLGHYEKPTMI
jgi:hypothetical protein